MDSIREQIHRNAVALISLFIAVSSLAYNSWRNETSEAQRNIRAAAFQVLQSLGELQEVTDYRYYYLPFDESGEDEGALRIRGYGSVTMVRDLMNLMPSPGPQAGEDLHRLWNGHVSALTELDEKGAHTDRARQAEGELTRAIEDTRAAVLMVLKELD